MFQAGGHIFSWLTTHTLRLSLGMVVMSILVAQCFVGPTAFVQYSTIPLPSNPIHGIISKIMSNLTSPGTFLELLVNPDPKQSLSQEIENRTTKKFSGVRYQSPTLLRICSQVLVHAIGGLLCARTVIPPSSVQDYAEGSLVSTSCTFISIAVYITIHLSNTHDAALRESSLISSAFHSNTMASVLRYIMKQFCSMGSDGGMVFYWMFTPLLSMTTLRCFSNLMDNTSWTDILLVLPIIYFTTFLFATYMIIMHIVIHMMLLVKGLNADRLISTSMESFRSNDYTVEDLMVESVLGGFCTHEELMMIIKPRATKALPGISSYAHEDIEEEEVQRNDEMISVVAASILEGKACFNITMQHELLKIHLLESIGGDDGCLQTTKAMDMSQRHHSNLLRRLNNGLVPGLLMNQAPIVPVLRTLLAYTGGVGEALTVLMKTTHLKTTTCSMPLFTLAALAYAVRGASRLITLNLVEKPNMNSNGGRHSRTSMLIPSFFISVYKLRCGLLDYAQYLSLLENETDIATLDRTTKTRVTQNSYSASEVEVKTLISFITLKYIDLSNLLSICEESAFIVKEAVEGRSYIDNLQPDCVKWIHSIHRSVEK